MGPHADFVCLSKHCKQEDGAATVYDLPVKATHCPMGHKRLQRLFNAVNVNSDHARKVDALAEGPISDALATKDAGTKARLEGLKRDTPALAVPISKVAGTLAAMGRGVAVGQTSRPVPRPAHGVQAEFRGRPMPAAIEARHTPKEGA